jgi:hypothetical protein
VDLAIRDQLLLLPPFFLLRIIPCINNYSLPAPIGFAHSLARVTNNKRILGKQYRETVPTNGMLNCRVATLDDRKEDTNGQQQQLYMGSIGLVPKECQTHSNHLGVIFYANALND